MRGLAILIFAVALPLIAQWTGYRDPQTPRKNGKPGLSGVWQAERTPPGEIAGVPGNEFANQQVDINDVNKYAL